MECRRRSKFSSKIEVTRFYNAQTLTALKLVNRWLGKLQIWQKCGKGKKISKYQKLKITKSNIAELLSLFSALYTVSQNSCYFVFDDILHKNYSPVTIILVHLLLKQ